MRALQQAGRGLIGAAALKSGGINFLLAIRNAFDRGVELFKQQKGAKVIQKELGDVTSDLLQAVREGFKAQRPGVRVGSGRVDTTPAVTGTTQQLIGQQRDVRAPQIEPFELRGNFQGAVPPAQPTQPASSSMFASLFPQDTGGSDS